MIAVEIISKVVLAAALGVVVIAICRMVATHDAHAEDGRVGQDTLHRIRKTS